MEYNNIISESFFENIHHHRITQLFNNQKKYNTISKNNTLKIIYSPILF